MATANELDAQKVVPLQSETTLREVNGTFFTEPNPVSSNRDHGDECTCGCQNEKPPTHDEGGTKPGVPRTSNNFLAPKWAT